MNPPATASGRGRRALGALALALAALLLLGYALTLVAALVGGGGHPPLAAVLWVGMILASLVLAPLGALLGFLAAVLERRALGAPGKLALVATVLHLALLAFALYYRFD